LLADGAGLTVDQLADALWGEQVPVGAGEHHPDVRFSSASGAGTGSGPGRAGRIVVTDNGRYRLAIPPDGPRLGCVRPRVDRANGCLPMACPLMQ
jgi:hypothetical protein